MYVREHISSVHDCYWNRPPVNLVAYLTNKWKITSKQNKTPTTHLYDSIILNGVIFAKPAKNSKCPASACNFYHATTKSEIHATAISFIYLSHSHQLYQLLSFGNDTNVGIWLTISALYWPPRWLGARKGIHPVSILLQLYPNIFLETFPGPLANPGKLEKWQFKTTNCVSNSFFFYSVIVFGTSTANSLNYLHLWLYPVSSPAFRTAPYIDMLTIHLYGKFNRVNGTARRGLGGLVSRLL